MGQYSVTVTMSGATVQALYQSGYFLNAFGVVRSSDHAASPVVWMQSQSYMQNTVLTWTGDLQGYLSASSLVVGGRISVGFSEPMSLGQLLTVNNGSGVVSDSGVPNSISILNSSTTPFVTGLVQGSSPNVGPICALPLYGQGLQIIQPVPSIFLMMSTISQTPGTVVVRSTGPGMLFSLSDSAQRTVSYDINQGWSAGGMVWAQNVPANAPLSPLLTGYSTSLASSAFRMQKLLNTEI